MAAVLSNAIGTKTNNDQNEKEINEAHERYREIISALPTAKGWWGSDLRFYQGFWCRANIPGPLPGVMCMQERFTARTDDVLVVSFPKSGTTWIKALVFAVMNRTHFDARTNHPLLTNGPHHCVPFLEFDLFNHGVPSRVVDDLPSPRVLSTHVPYPSLPKSVIDCHSCKIVYLNRDPKDVLVSSLHFFSNVANQFQAKTGAQLEMTSLDEAFHLFCKGISGFGPYWDHVLSYWKASLESPDKVMFLKYEDLKRDPEFYARKLGQFLGRPFSSEEEDSGVVKDIVELCSFQNLSNLEVNKTGLDPLSQFTCNVFFRKGDVGDWKNHLTLQMAEQLDQITRQKFDGTSLIL